MKNLWKVDFKAEEITGDAYSIILEQNDYLNKMTDGKIIAKIVEYDGPTHSYTVNNAFAQTAKIFEPKKINIQDNLGEMEDSKFVYELFITSSVMPNYKYRVMFVEYGIALYPVYVTLDEDIAAEIEEQEEIICETQQEFESKLEKILNSPKLIKIISNLLGLAKNEEKRFVF